VLRAAYIDGKHIRNPYLREPALPKELGNRTSRNNNEAVQVAGVGISDHLGFRVVHEN
jgi:hypothetical protein